MQTQRSVNLAVIFSIAGFLHATLVPAQHLGTSPTHPAAAEVYTPSLTPAIYLINFLFLYIANPDVGANLPAYKAPIPQSVVECLKQNPVGCPYATFRQCFEEQACGEVANRECFWPVVCQEQEKWAHLAPRKFRRVEEINEPLGKKRAEQLAHLLGITESMILTEAEYHCLIGIPPRSQDQETLFRCIYNMTNSKGNAAIPLSSYGLNVNEQGYVRSVCAIGSPCIEVNSLLTGYLAQRAAECGFLEKLLRMETETPFFQLLVDGNACQQSAGAACLVETTCAPK
jgi:hypothetical protein